MSADKKQPIVRFGNIFRMLKIWIIFMINGDNKSHFMWNQIQVRVYNVHLVQYQSKWKIYWIETENHKTRWNFLIKETRKWKWKFYSYRKKKVIKFISLCYININKRLLIVKSWTITPNSHQFTYLPTFYI